MPRSPSFSFPWTDQALAARVTAAVRAYWRARSRQSGSQKRRGTSDQGSRSEVTGGKHLDAFTALFREVALAAGHPESSIKVGGRYALPGYYRPQKQWDLVVAHDGVLYAAIELKSQVGSFGNNFNNRTEEALGSATDLWIAFREKALGPAQPWVGYFLMVEDSADSTAPIKLNPGELPVRPEFVDTSYVQRYAILCERLVLERNYTRAALITAPRGASGKFAEPLPTLSVAPMLKSLFAHLSGVG